MTLVETLVPNEILEKSDSQATRRWEQKTRENLTRVQVARTLHQAWHAEKEGLLTQIRRAGLQSQDTTKLKQRLVEITAEELIVPLPPVLFFEEATQEALASQQDAIKLLQWLSEKAI